MSKKRSVKGFKLKDDISSREMPDRKKSRDKREAKNNNTVKKNQLSQPSFDKGTRTVPTSRSKPI